MCQVIRIGNMELKEFDARTLRKSSHPVNNKKTIDEKFSLRRPFGVAGKFYLSLCLMKSNYNI